MGGAVLAHQAGPVDAEGHIQVLQRHVMDQLVVGALQEGGVDRHHRFAAFAGHAAGQRQGVLLADRHVVVALRETAREIHHAGAFAHGRGDADQARVLLGQVAQPLAEHFLVLGALRFGRLGHFHFRLGLDLVDRVVAHRVRFRRAEALALGGVDVQQLRPFQVAHGLQGGGQLVDVVAVDGADVVEADRLEQHVRADHVLHAFFGAAHEVPGRRHGGEHFLAAFAQGDVGLGRPDAREVVGQPAHVVADRHGVVVENHQQVGAGVGGVAHGFEGLAGRHGAVADHRHRAAFVAGLLGAQGHAQRGADRGGRVAHPEGVEFRLGAFREAGQAVLLPHGENFVAAAGENLVRVALVAHVPHQPVVGGVEQVMQGHGQFHHAEAGAEVPAGATHGVEQVGAQFVHHLLKVRFGQSPQVRRRAYAVQQRRVGAGQRNVGKRLLHWLGA